MSEQRGSSEIAADLLEENGFHREAGIIRSRKPIQIQVGSLGETAIRLSDGGEDRTCFHNIYAICNDGTVWCMSPHEESAARWIEMRRIPQGPSSYE